MSAVTWAVTIEGTWNRKGTSSQDLKMMRTTMVQQDPVYPAGHWRNGRRLPEDILEVTFKERRAWRDGEDRAGTFKAVVLVSSMASSSWKLSASSAQARALQQLKWYLQDVTCRPPKLKVLKSRRQFA